MKWLDRLFRKRKFQTELDSELGFHVEQKTAELITAGVEAGEARRRAKAKLGGIEAIKQEYRESRPSYFLESIFQDIRYALRGLARNPGLAAIAIVTLALGIGANTTIFSVAEAYFLRSLPGRDPAQLVTFTSRTPQGKDDYFSYPDYRDLEQASALSGVAAYSAHGGFLVAHGNSRLIVVDIVSRNFFHVLGVSAIRGRMFSPAKASGASSVPSIILSYAIWRGSFGGDPELVGKNVTLTGKTYTVIGIAPPSFRGLDRLAPTSAWLPLDEWYSAQDLGARGFRDFQLLGRVKPDVNAAQAQAQVAAISNRLAQVFPATNAARTFGLTTERERFRRGLVPTSFLLAATLLVLLIACANIAGLLVAQAETRRRETAIRLALGAGRLRLIRQWLIESAVLGSAGAGLAIVLSSWLIGLQPAFMPPSPIEVGANLRIDSTVAVFTLAVAMIAVLIFGLTPAISATKMNVAPALKSDGRAGGRAERHTVRNVLVVAEVALSVVLMCGAALLSKSLIRTLNTNLGFATHKNLLFANLGPGAVGKNPSRSWEYFQRLSRQVATLPGVRGATFALHELLGLSGGGYAAAVSIPGVQFPQGQPNIEIKCNAVAPGYFRTIGTAILQGRAFTSADGPRAPKVVIVDQTMALRFWPHGDAIGRTIKVHGAEFQIVGIAENAKINSVHELPEPYMYFPFAQKPDGEGTLIVETAQSPAAMAGEIREEIHSVNPEVPIVYEMTLSQTLHAALWDDYSAADLSVTLGLLGIFLAAIGLYGVIAYLVNGRAREIGLRMALGAQHGAILRLVIGQGLKLASIGAVVGLVAALGASRLMASLLYGLSPYDPASLAAACVFALIIAVAASYFPARRATRVDPVVALRQE